MSGTSHPGLPFNPYKAWLGIDVTGRKPTHYELLGLEFGVVDAATAKASVLERSAKVRHYQAGKHADLAAQVLDELAEAQLVLTNAEKKKEYDKKFPIVSVTLVTQEKELAPTPSPFDNPSSEKKSRAFSRKISNPPKKKTGYRIPPALAIVILVLTVIGHVTLGLGTYAWLMGGSDPKRNEVKNERPAVVQSQPVMESKLSQSGDRKEHQEIRYNGNKPLSGVGLALADGKSNSSNTKSKEGITTTSGQSAGTDSSGMGDPKPTNSNSNLRESGKDSTQPSKITNSIGMELAFIPKGKFLMGSLETEQGHEKLESPQHEVVISRNFFIGIYEVTQNEYLKVTGKNPSYFQEEKTNTDTSRYPVEQVSWNDAVEFCNQLSQLPEERKYKRNYRLPTEAEWEYCCRAGSTDLYSFGNNNSNTGDFGWFDNNSEKMTHAVGKKKPNSWGLFDMHGNVFEWCSDWLDGYKLSDNIDPIGPANGQSRIFRGGGWDWGPPIGRSARRVWSNPSEKYNARGFRVVLNFNDNTDSGLRQNSNVYPAKKIFLSELSQPKWLAEEPWRSLKDDYQQPNSFRLHPFHGPKVAIARHDIDSYMAFSSKVRLDADPGSPIRFAVRVDDKILWQSRDLAKKGDADECWIDVRGRKQINLLTRARDSHKSAWATWQDPHFINSNDYDEKIKAYQKPIDDPAVTNYWNDIGNPPFGTTPMPPVATSRIRFVEPLQLMTKEVVQRNSNMSVKTAVSIYKHHLSKREMEGNKITLDKLTQNGWGVDKTIGYLLSEPLFGGPHDIKDKDMIFLTSRVDPKLNNTQYLLSNQVNLQTDHIVVFIGWVFTRRIPGTIPVAIRRNPGIGNTFTHALLVGDDAIRSNKNIQVLGTFFIYEKDPNIKQADTGTGSPSVPNQNNSSASPSNKTSGSQTSDNSHHQFDAKALAAGGQAIFSLFREKNGHPEAYFTGNIVENTRMSSLGWKSLGMIGKASNTPQKENIVLKRLPNNQGIPEYPQYFIGSPPNERINSAPGHGWVWLEQKPGLIECLLMRTKREGLYSLVTDKQEIASRMKTGQWTIEKRFYILPPD